jgi:hypothetical protein
LALALRLGDHRPLLAFGLHLAGHGVGDVGRRLQILDLDARHLDAPRAGGLVDDGQEAGVDLVALREHFVQLHRTNHGAQIGHGELADGVVEVGHPVGRRRRVHDLDEDDGVHLDGDVVLGDHLLARHVQHLLHDADLAPHRLHERHEDGDARLESAGVAAEPLDRVLIALRHDLDGRDGQEDSQDDQGDWEEGEHGAGTFARAMAVSCLSRREKHRHENRRDNDASV